MKNKVLSESGKKGAKNRWAKKHKLLEDLKKVATAEQYKYVEKLREKSLFAVGGMILELSKNDQQRKA